MNNISTPLSTTPSSYPAPLEREETDIQFIPNELMLQIFEKLDFISILRAAPTCKLWMTLSKDKSILRPLFHKYLPDTAKSSPKTNLDENFFLQHLVGEARIRSKSCEIKPILTEIPAEDFIIDTKLIDGKLFVRTRTSIDIWDTKTERKVNSIKGNFSHSSAIEIADGKLFSTSPDKTIHIQDIETGDTLKLLACPSMITKIYVANGKMITRDLSETISIRDAETGDVIKVIDSKVSDFWVDDGKIFACTNDDNKIRVWDAETGEVLRTLEGHRNLTFLGAAQGKLFSASEDSTISIRDAESGKQLKTLQGHTDRIFKLEIIDNKLISYSFDCTIGIWDIETGTLLRKLDTSNPSEGKERLCIHSVQIEGGKIFGAAIGTIQIWNFNQNAKNPIK